jgi:signal recognition particle subunit SRP54
MGDIVGLVSTAMEKFDQEETARLQAKMEKGEFTLEDFVSQMGQVKKLGSMNKIMGMIPGMSELSKTMNMGEGDVEKQMGRMHAIYNSMSKVERKKPDTLVGPRRRRIARGAGVDVNEVGQFMKQFEMMRGMMRAVGGMGVMGKLKMMKALASGQLNTLGMPGGPMLKTKKRGWMAPKDRNKKKRR